MKLWRHRECVYLDQAAVAAAPRASAHADDSGAGAAEPSAGVGLAHACRVDAVDAGSEAV